MHAVIFVLGANNVFEQTDLGGAYYQEIRKKKQACILAGCDPIVLLTKVDLLDPELSDKYKGVYTSEELCKVYEHLEKGAQFDLNHVYPMKSYNKEGTRDPHIECSALLALSAALRQGYEQKKAQLSVPSPRSKKKTETKFEQQLRMLQNPEPEPERESKTKHKPTKKSKSQPRRSELEENETPEGRHEGQGFSDTLGIQPGFEKLSFNNNNGPQSPSSGDGKVPIQIRWVTQKGEKKKQRNISPEDWDFTKLLQLAQQVTSVSYTSFKINDNDVESADDLGQFNLEPGYVLDFSE